MVYVKDDALGLQVDQLYGAVTITHKQQLIGL